MEMKGFILVALLSVNQRATTLEAPNFINFSGNTSPQKILGHPQNFSTPLLNIFYPTFLFEVIFIHLCGVFLIGVVLIFGIVMNFEVVFIF